MPAVPISIVDSTFYLYPTVEAAAAGSDFGGTGFIVMVPSAPFPKQWAYYYAVTNRHVFEDHHSEPKGDARLFGNG